MRLLRTLLAIPLALSCGLPQLAAAQSSKVKLSPCDSGSALAHAPISFGVGTATLAKACPNFAVAGWAYYENTLKPSLSATQRAQADGIIRALFGAKPVDRAAEPTTIPGTPKESPTVPTVPSQPTTPTAATLAFADFDNGSLSPYYTPVEWSKYVTVVADPTGSGRGKVVQINYTGSGSVIDLNKAVYFTNPANLPAHFFFTGDFYVPTGTKNYTNTAVQRKLIYNRGLSSASASYRSLVIFQWGDKLGYDIQGPSDNQKLGLATVSAGAWHRLEYEVQWNSSPTTSDGIFRLWLDGKLVSEQTKVRYYSSGIPEFDEMAGVGYQREGTTGETSVSEIRYWDRIGYATTRIP